MDQTPNAKMMDENSETFKHDTEFHEFRTAVAAVADPQHARMAKEVTRSSPRPSGKASSSTSSSLTRLVRTTQFSRRRRWSPAGREECDEFAARDEHQRPGPHSVRCRITYTRRRCTKSNSSRTGLTSRAGQTFSQSRMIERSGRQQSTVTRRTSTEVERESETTTEIAAQATVESHNEGQKVVKAREYPRSTSSKAMILTMWARRRRSRPIRPQTRNPRLQKSTQSETRTLNSTLEIERTATSTSTRQ